jgi:dTDP-4-dehydrorhamnose reductase
MKSILVIGSEGYIGHNLAAYFEAISWTVFSTGQSSSKRANYHAADICDQNAVRRIILDLKPDVVLHVAGISSLAHCENDPAACRAVNVDGTRHIIEAVAEVGATCKLVFFSSDYVFDGEAGNYDEKSPCHPLTEYGRAKVVSEDEIRRRLDNYVILRMANVYGRGGKFYNFVRERLEVGSPIELFNDTLFAPVSIDYLLRAVKVLIEKDFRGVLHLGGPQCLSRYDFGLLVAEHLNADPALVSAVPQPAGGLISRNSSLCTTKSAAHVPCYNPPVAKALHIMAGLFTYPHLHYVDARGLIHGVTQLRDWEEINYSQSAANAVRGNHYHRRTTEGFYIISGRMKVSTVSLADGRRYWFYAEAGDSFVITPMHRHTFEIVEDSSWINYLSRAMVEGEEKDICV